jgi:predicted transcriptional regulator
MTASPFSVRLASETKAKLEKWAEKQDRPVSFLVQRALESYIEDLEQFDRSMLEAEAELDKGVFTSWEKVKTWMESWDTDNELPMPEPDIFPSRRKAKSTSTE